MKSGKFLFIAIICLVSLLCISAVSAADDAASDIVADANDETVLEESIDEDVLEDGVNDELESSDEIALDSADDGTTLEASSPGTFTELNQAINLNNNSEISLTRDYKYVDSDSEYKNGIDICRSLTINGNGHTLDGSNTARMFQINGWAVIHLKNIKFVNGNALDGGAIFSQYIWDVYAENCTFIDNTASRTGGAIYRIYATDSTFINNSAGDDGGAMFAATANNCAFIQNTANLGGAMSYGTANNCIFLFNSASNSPDHYAGDSNNCTFIDSGTLSVSDFITEPHSGEKLLFNFSATVYGEKKNFNVYTTIKITSEDGQEVGNYHALSGEGLALDLNPGKYIATLSIENENVDFATASITVASGTSFTGLNSLINDEYPGNTTIYLTKDYTYDPDFDAEFTNGITIDHSVTIDGNGHTINGAGAARMFYVEADNVVIKNLNFINGYSYDGGAIYWGVCSHGNISGCTFVNNHAEDWGGAILWAYRSDNIAYNCTFDGNSAGDKGGAVLSVPWVGATVENCIAKTSSDTQFNMICIAPTLTVNNVTTTFYGDTIGFKLLPTNSSVPINDANVIVEVYQNDNLIRTYNCLSGEGWVADLPVGSYNITYKTQYIGFEQVTAPLTIATDSSFSVLNALINKLYLGNSTIYLTKDYTYDPAFDAEFQNGITLAHNVTIDGKGHTINGAEAARSFRTGDSKYNVTFKNINFKNCFTTGNGGAIYAPASTVINCNFTNNKADMHGGAGCLKTVINCTFTSNTAQIGGGAVEGAEATNCYFYNNHADSSGGAIHNSDATNCTFNGNSANYGGAISYGDAVKCTFTGNSANYGGAISNGHAVDSTFTENHAESRGGAIYHGTAENCNFTNNDANYLGGAIYGGSAVKCIFDTNKGNAYGGAISGDIDTKEPCSAVNCTFTNNCAWAGGALYFGDAINCTFNGNYILRPENSAGNGAAMCGYWDDNDSPCTAINCIFTNNSADEKNAIYKCIADTCVFNGDTYGYDLTILQPVLNAANFISTYNDGSNLVVNITTNSGMPVSDAKIKVDVYKTNGDFVGTYNILSGGWKVPLNAGSYIAYYNATDFDIENAEGMIVVNKAKTTVTSKAVTAVYNNNKYLVITLKDNNGKALSGVYVTVTLSSAKKYKTDKNGQIKVNVGKLVPKTYTAKISFAGNTNYLASSTTAKVVVKKATPKMTAKAKTFKVKVKTKKYTITLKNNVNKVLKNTKVTLKVNKKTFTAKTNSKGVATFKITNLKKKGKYTATIKFAGNKYYKALSKKAKITVKK